MTHLLLLFYSQITQHKLVADCDTRAKWSTGPTTTQVQHFVTETNRGRLDATYSTERESMSLASRTSPS